MIKWYLFLQAGQPIDMGILDSNMEKLMSEELFLLYKQTYPTAEYVRIWDAFDAVVKLWNVTGNAVAGHCGYDYSADTEKQMLSLIKDLREDQN